MRSPDLRKGAVGGVGAHKTKLRDTRQVADMPNTLRTHTAVVLTTALGTALSPRCCSRRSSRTTHASTPLAWCRKKLSQDRKLFRNCQQLCLFIYHHHHSHHHHNSNNHHRKKDSSRLGAFESKKVGCAAQFEGVGAWPGWCATMLLPAAIGHFRRAGRGGERGDA